MQQFKDKTGQTWAVDITVGSLKTIREATGIKLGDLYAKDTGLGDLIYAEPEKLGALLWVLVEEQADAMKLTEEQFVKRLNGESLNAAISAILAACANFFRSGKTAKTLTQRLPEILERIDQEAATKLDQAVAKFLLNDSVGNSQASPE